MFNLHIALLITALALGCAYADENLPDNWNLVGTLPFARRFTNAKHAQ